MTALKFPFAVINGDLQFSSTEKLDAIKSVVQTFKYERIRQPAYGNERAIFRAGTDQNISSYLKGLQLELQQRVQDGNIDVLGDINSDGILALSIFYDGTVYYATI